MAVDKVGEELKAGQKGFKTTSLRIPQSLFDESAMLAEAMSQSMTDFIVEAMVAYVPVAARDPRALKMAKRRANEAIRQVKKLEAMAKGQKYQEEDDDE